MTNLQMQDRRKGHVVWARSRRFELQLRHEQQEDCVPWF
eukprot:CAMPEP_0114299638 /NCGR_PEP_ID=MMETSP0059-20121206/13084_1 /TAXON_ID=36894 /ORGANISM="Pyramimonas parkeae, Strain CCMP726" /LENGTH=38 /DNA_ID= /DNA_START= /DNA_END= /DNA_ORIENTATION=